MNSTLTLETLKTTDWTPAKPQAVAQALMLPLSVAKAIMAQASSGCTTLQDGRNYYRLTDLKAHRHAYLASLPYSPEFEPLGHRGNLVVLPAFEDEWAYLHVWCMWCREFHHHGQHEGKRAAHCEWDSPWKEHGYFLQSVGPWNREILRLARGDRYPLPETAEDNDEG